jgi:hypothetical protein
MAQFRPSSDGFAFTNAWPNQAAMQVPTPFGQVAVGNAANGLCGGMVFAALDYWHAHVTAPTERPGPGQAAYAFIVQRLIDSWHVPAGVAQYYQWMNLPDADRTFTVMGHTVLIEHGLAWRTVTEQWPAVRADLDQQIPVPLGLVTVQSANPSDLGLNHQVLAWGYTQDGGQDGPVTVQVYDPNSGQRDDITLSFDPRNPAGPTTFPHTINIGHPVRGFFRTAYSPEPPPPPMPPATTPPS